MVATCTASLRLEKTTNKNMYSRGNTATYHYYAALPRGIAAYVFFAALPQILSLHCRFCLVAACRKCVRGILPFVFRGIFEALPLLFCSLFLAAKCS